MMQTLDQLLENSEKGGRDRLCLIERGGQTATYGDLAARADQIAQSLGSLGVRAGDRVGLCCRKSIATVAAIFAILKLHAVYVPVDPSAPAARSASIFADCRVRAVLADPGLFAALADNMRDDHPVEDQGLVASFNCLIHAGNIEPAPEGTAYILYTSGSTGKPKGVVHTHASAAAFVDWCSDRFTPGSVDRFSSHAPFHFDLSVLDLYVAVKHGAAIRLIDAEEGKQPKALCELIEKDRLTFWYSTPTVLRSMLEFGAMQEHDLTSIRILCFAGEVFPPKHLKAFAKALPRPQYFNLYGPTETNVCTFYQFPDPASLAEDADIPIGYASSDDELLVADASDLPVADGEDGELLVSGGSVMVGYWGLPERNAIAFSEIGGRRWYRTGDVVRKRPDGALLYRGRRDRMVKRRGYRIELDEIEAAMLRHAQIGQGIAVAAENASGDTQIAFFHCTDGDTTLSLLELKRFAAQHLPRYMIPDRFQAIEQMPMTSTDKVDHQKLKERARGLFADN